MNTKISILITTITAMLFASVITIAARQSVPRSEGVIINDTTWSYDFSVDGIYYNIISSSVQPYTVEITRKSANECAYAGNVWIPTSVKYLGNRYEVASIGKEAFKGCKDLKSIAMSDLIEHIGEKAFYGCDNLRSIIFSDRIDYSRLSSYNIDSLKLQEGDSIKIGNDIVCKKTWSGIFTIKFHNPPIIAADALAFNRTKCILYAPKGKIEMFLKNESWKGFRAYETNAKILERFRKDRAKKEIKQARKDKTISRKKIPVKYYP